MYRKFREDPASVDDSWHEFLVDYSPEPTSETSGSGGNGQSTSSAAPAKKSAEAKPADEAKSESKSADKAESKPEPKAESKTKSEPESKKSESAKAEPAKAEPAKPKAAAAEGDELQVLRGAAAAVVKNMSASLNVPTATSVRAIPAKLMVDNRIVINNHLKRARGG